MLQVIPIVFDTANTLVLEILEQDESDRAKTESEYRRFVASNGFVISSETCPDVIYPDTLCIRGANKDKDNRPIKYMFGDKTALYEYVNSMMVAIKEFNNKPKSYKVKVRKVKNKVIHGV